MMLPRSPWLVPHRVDRHTERLLLCFHHAGGAANAFRAWPARLPADVGVVAVELPGRGGRFAEPPLESLDAVVEGLLGPLSPLLERPHAFFGHSMGARIAFEVAHARVLAGHPAPVHLFVSSHPAPHLPRKTERVSELSDGEFVARLRRYGGTPPEVLAHEELMALILPTLRADFRLVEAAEHRPRPPLPCPISAFGGRSDDDLPLADLEAWRAQSGAAFEVALFPGGHFYLLDAGESGPALLSRVSSALCAAGRR